MRYGCMDRLVRDATALIYLAPRGYLVIYSVHTLQKT